jgi:hypothetical protein
MQKKKKTYDAMVTHNLGDNSTKTCMPQKSFSKHKNITSSHEQINQHTLKNSWLTSHVIIILQDNNLLSYQ